MSIFISSNPRHEFDYVEDRSCLRAQCNCLCGTGTCRFCCRGCPSCKESTFTRTIYIFFLIFVVLIMATFMSEIVQVELMKIFPNKYAFCDWLGAGPRCHAGKLLGYLVVYRIGFAVSLYHFILLLATCGVKSSKDCRAAFHNGLWIYKLMLMVVLILLSFFIPDQKDYFINVWMYMAMTGAAAFIVVQMLVLVFMVHKCNDKIMKRVQKGGSPVAWFAVFAPTFAIVFFILSGAGVCCLFIYFAGDEGCFRNQWFIMINAGGCLVVSFVAGVRKDSKPVGLRLLHASIICLYITYLTWMAISSAPRRFQRFARHPSPSQSRQGFHPRFSMSFQQEFYCGPSNSEEIWADQVIPYISFLITFLTVIYGAISISTPEKIEQDPEKLERDEYDDECEEPEKPEYERDDTGGQIILRDEKKRLRYNYPMFHLLLMFAVLLIMMHFTQWHTHSRATIMTFGRSWSSVWIKMSASWACLIIYFISLLCPSILRRRRSRKPSPVVVEVNGHVYESDSEYDAISFEEVAVPLTLTKRPTMFITHQETTV